MAAMETRSGAEAMAYDGVVPETLVILVIVFSRKLLGRPSRLPTSGGHSRHTGTGDECALTVLLATGRSVHVAFPWR